MGPKNRVFYHLGLFPRYFGRMPTKAGPLAGCKGPQVLPGLVREAAAHTGVSLALMGPPYAAQMPVFGPFGPTSAPFWQHAGQGGSLRAVKGAPCAPRYGGGGGGGGGHLLARACPCVDRGGAMVPLPRPKSRTRSACTTVYLKWANKYKVENKSRTCHMQRSAPSFNEPQARGTHGSRR